MVDKIVDSLHLSGERLNEVKNSIHRCLLRGIGKRGGKCCIKCFPTHVRAFPTGHESGDYFCLDLGGSNFRVLLIQLDNGKVHVESNIYPLAPELKTGTGVQLFDYVAECLGKFKAENGLSDQNLPLGFTFSFACIHNDLTSATIVSWCKGWHIDDIIGKDVAVLLREACERKGVQLGTVAVLNDSTGTLMSCAYTDHNACIGLILGTGTNACYMEKLENVEIWDGDRNDPQEVIINTEWGSYGEDGCLDHVRTKFDMQLDDSTIDRGRLTFEKMISGMYLGELARLILVNAADNHWAFDGKGSSKLSTPWAFETRFISDIEGDTSETGDVTKKILTENLHLNPSPSDIRITRDVCAGVSLRAANLVSAGLAALIEQMQCEILTVAVDGTLFRKHPKFHDMTMESLNVLVPGVKVKLMCANDGSGKGAGLVAALVHNNKAA